MANIEDLINNVTSQDFSKSGPLFKDIMSDKMSDALEAEKIAVASAMMGQENSDDDIEDEDDFEIDEDDEDLDVTEDDDEE